MRRLKTWLADFGRTKTSNKKAANIWQQHKTTTTAAVKLQSTKRNNNNNTISDFLVFAFKWAEILNLSQPRACVRRLLDSATMLQVAAYMQPCARACNVVRS